MNFYYLSIGGLCFHLITSCEKNIKLDDARQGEGKLKEDQDGRNRDIVGSWKSNEASQEKVHLILKADHTAIIAVDGNYQAGSYTVDFSQMPTAIDFNWGKSGKVSTILMLNNNDTLIIEENTPNSPRPFSFTDKKIEFFRLPFSSDDSSVAILPGFDPLRVDAYITPYYNSKGPVVNVGRFSAGLASMKEEEFLKTIFEMKALWNDLSFPELYVASIRLYEFGYRKEAVYWFYTAQYRGRQFAMLVDKAKVRSYGHPGFELIQAQNSFQQLLGPYINGYAFGEPESLVSIVKKVQQEGRIPPNLSTTYGNVAFKSKHNQETLNTELANGMDRLVTILKEEKDEIKRQRIDQGTEEIFSKVTSKELNYK